MWCSCNFRASIIRNSCYSFNVSASWLFFLFSIGRIIFLICWPCLFLLQNLNLKICNHILIWVEEQTYWIASRFLTLGFDLDLYSPSEYCMVYWYIYVVLIKLAEKTHFKAMTSAENREFAFLTSISMLQVLSWKKCVRCEWVCIYVSISTTGETGWNITICQRVQAKVVGKALST